MVEPSLDPARCSQCGTQIAPSLLVCPSCKQLVHSTELKRLSAEAEEAAVSGEIVRSLTAWREVLDLLPRGTRQHEVVTNKIDTLSRQVEASGQVASPPAPGEGSKWKKTAAGVGAGGAILSLLSKGKLLLLGLTKAGTLFSMLLSFGVYWTAWGWKFALGLVVSIYVHEMGHVFMLRRYGIKASAPMFIPGLGAVVRLKQYPVNPVEDARVGLAGPQWGLGAAVAAYLIFLTSGWHSMAGIARVGAWINMLNLIPLVPLDGGRGIRSLNRIQRWSLVVLSGILWYLTRENLLLAIGFMGALNSFSRAPVEPDYRGFVEFAVLLIALSLMCMIHVPGISPL